MSGCCVYGAIAPKWLSARVAAAGVALGAAAGIAAAGDILYAVGSGVGDGSSNLYIIDGHNTNAPVAINIGEPGTVLGDLAINADGSLAYAIQGNAVYKIDLSTAATTFVGTTGVEFINALEFTPNGTLWGWASGSANLFQIDQQTGQATFYMPGIIGSAGDLAAADDVTLYGAGFDRELVRFDLASKTVEWVGTLQGIAGGDVFGLEIGSDGVMYGLAGLDGSGLADLYTIDPKTLQATFVGSVGNNQLGGYGLAMLVPAPGATALGLGALLMAIGRRRRA